MARRQKTLEEQYNVAQGELSKAEEKVKICKQIVSNIQQQIEDRNMREAYALLKKNNVSVDQLEIILKKQAQQNKEKKTA